MGIRNIGSDIITGIAINPQTTSAGTVNGTGFSHVGYESGVFVGIVGYVVGTPDATTVTFKLQSAATDTSALYADISGATAVVTATNRRGEIDWPLANESKYIRMVATTSHSGGTAPTCGVSGLYILGGPKESPV